MSRLEFLSPDRAAPQDGFEPRLRSPVAEVLEAAGRLDRIEDVSLTYAKIEVRGDLADLPPGAEAVRITDERALLICPYDDGAELRGRLEGRFRAVVDRTAALAGVRLEGRALLRRVTDLDLDRLPAVGAVARIQAVVLADGEESFRLFFPQEYGRYLAEVVLDTAKGLP